MYNNMVYGFVTELALLANPWTLRHVIFKAVAAALSYDNMIIRSSKQPIL